MSAQNQNPNSEPNTPATPPPNTPATPPATPDIVDNVSAKRIRELEGQLSKSEESTKSIREELDGLRAIVRKAGETKLPENPPKKQTVLEYIDNLLFKS